MSHSFNLEVSGRIGFIFITSVPAVSGCWSFKVFFKKKLLSLVQFWLKIEMVGNNTDGRCTVTQYLKRSLKGNCMCVAMKLL